ncbi:MAG: hypothetical protein WCS70_02145 [Verrucomicrobiota bacterium]
MPPTRASSTPVARDRATVEVALLVSLLIHAAAFLTWQYRGVLAKFSLFKPVISMLEQAPRPVAPRPMTPTITFIEAPPEQKPKENRAFIETDDTQATGAEPKDARFYSDRSTTAANLKNPTDKVGDTPFLEGKETRMMATDNVVPSSGAPPPRPAAPPVAPPRPVAPPAPKPEPPPKKLAEEGFKVIEEKKVALLEKPVAPVLPPTPAAPPVEPMPPASPGAGSSREIATLKSNLRATGVSRIGVAAFNVAGSPFGAYDKALIRAVQSRWYALIEKNGLYERAGQVTLKFNLAADGSVTKLAISENTAGEILGLFCEKAIVDSAPFTPLPDMLRNLIGDDAREVSFTFYY